MRFNINNMKTNPTIFRYILFLIFSMAVTYNATAQEVSIELGQGEISLNEAFTITIKVKNDKLRTHNSFPAIPGFSKRGTSSSSSTRIVNGQIDTENSLTQTYAPQKEGTFRLEPFEITINGETVSSSGKTITVGPPRQQNRNSQRQSPFGRDPFQDIFGDGSDEENTEFVEIQDDAFFGLQTDKDEVYVGEGFTATLAFYISQENRAPLSFHDLGSQLGKIVKELKPENAWEENFEIANIQREDVKINGKSYARYKLYQARYYPLNAKPVTFPRVGLKMIKYKVAKRPSFFGRRQEEDFKTYYTKPKTVQVKELPPHPLKEQVSVGDYQLREQLSTNNLETGNSFSYSFSIVGQGNIAAIREPELPPMDSLTLYEPNVSQNTRKDGGTLIGVKQFSYYGIPNEPGVYHLGNYFSWIYFNPRLQNYDTLRSKQVLKVTGESLQDENILTKDPGAFYNRMEYESNALVNLEDEGNMSLFINIFILLILLASAFIIFKK